MTTHEQEMREYLKVYDDPPWVRWAIAEIDRLRELLAFSKFDLKHKPSYAAICLDEGEISLGKFCEYVSHLSVGIEDPLIEGVLRSGGRLDDRSRAELLELLVLAAHEPGGE